MLLQCIVVVAVDALVVAIVSFAIAVADVAYSVGVARFKNCIPIPFEVPYASFALTEAVTIKVTQ